MERLLWNRTARVASVLVVWVAWLAPVQAQPATPVSNRPWAKGVTAYEQHVALDLYRAGNRDFEDSRWVQAIAKYHAAIKHWDHPEIRFNLAVALINSDESLEAKDCIDRSLAYGDEPLGAEHYKEAVLYRKLLDRQLVKVTIEVETPGTNVTLDGKPLVIEPAGEVTAVVLPGAHQVVATKGGYVTWSDRPSWAPDQPQLYVIEMQQSPPPPDCSNGKSGSERPSSVQQPRLVGHTVTAAAPVTSAVTPSVTPSVGASAAAQAHLATTQLSISSPTSGSASTMLATHVVTSVQAINPAPTANASSSWAQIVAAAETPTPPSYVSSTPSYASPSYASPPVYSPPVYSPPIYSLPVYSPPSFSYLPPWTPVPGPRYGGLASLPGVPGPSSYPQLPPLPNVPAPPGPAFGAAVVRTSGKTSLSHHSHPKLQSTTTKSHSSGSHSSGSHSSGSSVHFSGGGHR